MGAAILDLTSWGPPSWCRGGRHLGSDVVGAAILDRKSWGSPSWTGSDVIGAKPAPILLLRSCSKETKANACFSMVRSNLEYFSTVWSPHHKDQIHLIEMAQRRAARYTTNRFRNTISVSSMNGTQDPKFSYPSSSKWYTN